MTRVQKATQFDPSDRYSYYEFLDELPSLYSTIFQTLDFHGGTDNAWIILDAWSDKSDTSTNVRNIQHSSHVEKCTCQE